MKPKEIILKNLLISIIIVVLLAIVGGGIFFIFPPKPCGYINFAWGNVKKDCDCIGIKVDTSCKDQNGGPCPDAGGKTSCLGIVTKRKCYNSQGYDRTKEKYIWEETSCTVNLP